jgi:hypothetical protein
MRTALAIALFTCVMALAGMGFHFLIHLSLDQIEIILRFIYHIACGIVAFILIIIIGHGCWDLADHVVSQFERRRRYDDKQSGAD